MMKSRRKFLKHLETNENTTIQNVWNAAKGVLRRKFTAIQALHTHTKKKNRKISNNLTYHLKESDKEQTKHKGHRRKEIIKIREEIKYISWGSFHAVCKYQITVSTPENNIILYVNYISIKNVTSKDSQQRYRL